MESETGLSEGGYSVIEKCYMLTTSMPYQVHNKGKICDVHGKYVYSTLALGK